MLILPAAMAGCAFKGDLAGAQSRAAQLDASAWQPQPHAVRVYPSTRYAHEGDQLLIEARLELLDEMGDSLKASGDYHLRLLTTGHVSGSEEADLLYQWDVRVRTLPDHQNTYDPITRTYLLRLKMNQSQPPQDNVTLHVTFTPVQAAPLPDHAVPVRLQTQAVIDPNM